MKKFLTILSISILLSSCGSSLGNIAIDGLDALKTCSLKCGASIAVDALSCPINGGSYKEMLDNEVKRGLAMDAATCILNCMAGHAIDVLGEACK